MTKAILIDPVVGGCALKLTDDRLVGAVVNRVLVKTTPDATEVPMPGAKVRLSRLRDGLQLWEGYSGPNGDYRAYGMPLDEHLVPVAIDTTAKYEAVAAGPVSPDHRYQIDLSIESEYRIELPGIVGWVTADPLPDGISIEDSILSLNVPRGAPGDYEVHFNDFENRVTIDLIVTRKELRIDDYGLVDVLSADSTMKPAMFFAVGGIPPYEFSYSGALPDGTGFTDNRDGSATWYGDPIEGGEYNFAVTLTDAVNQSAIFPVAGVVAEDTAYWDYVVGLYRWDGSAIVDRSMFGGTLTTNTGLVPDAVETKPQGEIALKLPAGKKAIFTLPMLRTDDFTIEMWILAKTTNINYPRTWATSDDASSQDYNILSFFDPGGGSSTYAEKKAVIAVTTNISGAWHHHRICRASGVWYAFLDGVDVTESSSPSVDIQTETFVLGQAGLSAIDLWFSEIRILKGLALSKTGFVPPTDPFETR